MGRAQWRGGRVHVDFSSLLCESQGMVTINILYSLKPSKNTILEVGVGGWREGCAHFLAAPPRCIQAGRVMPGAAHIYIFINTGLYNETGLCQEQHFLLVSGLGCLRGNKGVTATFREGSQSSTLTPCSSPCGER